MDYLEGGHCGERELLADGNVINSDFDSQCLSSKVLKDHIHHQLSPTALFLFVSLAQEDVEPRHPFGRPDVAERRRPQGAQTMEYFSRSTTYLTNVS